MKSKLTKEETAFLIPKIQEVLKTGEEWIDEDLHHPVEAIVGAVLSISGMKRRTSDDPSYGVDGFETNGWQWDWWQQFEYKGKPYTLSGSGYHGGHSFSLACND